MFTMLLTLLACRLIYYSDREWSSSSNMLDPSSLGITFHRYCIENGSYLSCRILEARSKDSWPLIGDVLLKLNDSFICLGRFHVQDDISKIKSLKYKHESNPNKLVILVMSLENCFVTIHPTEIHRQAFIKFSKIRPSTFNFCERDGIQILVYSNYARLTFSPIKH